MTLPGHEPDPYAAQAGEIEMELELKMACDVVEYVDEIALAQNVDIDKFLTFVSVRLMKAREPHLHVHGERFGGMLQEAMQQPE